jgi:hypothetical protein
MGETERLVKDAMHAAGIPERKIGRDARGRLEGVKTAISATGIVLADVATVPERDDSCYVCIVGRYDSRSQIPSLLGRQSPNITQEVRSTLRGKARDALTVL